MATVTLQLIDRWPGGSPVLVDTNGVDGTIRVEGGITVDYDDATRVVIPHASGVDERFPQGVTALAVDADGDMAPTNPAPFAWYGRATAGAGVTLVNIDGLVPDVVTPAFAYARRTSDGGPSLVSLPLSAVPPGTDVFVCTSRREANGNPSGSASVQPGHGAYVGEYFDAHGMLRCVDRGRVYVVNAPGGRLAPAHLLFNRIALAAFRPMSLWTPMRVVAVAAASEIIATDGTRYAPSTPSSFARFGEAPTLGRDLELVVTLSSIPWFRSTDPRDTALGPFPGEASARLDAQIEGSPPRARAGWIAVEVSGTRWRLIRLRA